MIYLEAMPGVSRPAGRHASRSTRTRAIPTVLPHFQIVASRALGNGSAAMCDDRAPAEPIGGVPAVNPPMFGGSQAVSNAINDLSCRFDARSALTGLHPRPLQQMEGFTSAGSRRYSSAPRPVWARSWRSRSAIRS